MIIITVVSKLVNIFLRHFKYYFFALDKSAVKQYNIKCDLRIWQNWRTRQIGGCGGIGRRARLRIWCLRRAGSSPVTRTNGVETGKPLQTERGSPRQAERRSHGRTHHKYKWGISAVGSASHWQCGGQGFESPMLHQEKTLKLRRFAGFRRF